MQTSFTDFFIIENQSKNSIEIQEYFLGQNLVKNASIVGYYQFEENITNNAVRIFLDKNKELLSQYEYITFSDCDLYVDDAEDTFKEIFNNLHCEDVLFSCVDLDEKNKPPKNVWKTSVPKPLSITKDYIECFTGTHLETILNKNLHIYYDVKNFLDSSFHKYTQRHGKKWVKTLKNKAIHLTWDLCYEGSEYVKFKNEIGRKRLWQHDKVCGFITII